MTNPNPKIGLFFGSFNPIHNGHVAIAEYVFNFLKLEELWFILSPQNPFKLNADLLDEKKRFELLKIGISKNIAFKALDIELQLSKPSYTIHTLESLKKMHLKADFFFMMGADQIPHFHQWKEYEEILKLVDKLVVYPRENQAVDFSLLNIKIKEKLLFLEKAPLMEFSATEIRERIKNKQSIHDLVPAKVEELITKEGLYSY